ncbi:MAG: thiamine biosynthesis protein ThiS [Vulcanimicrobiota bacterium]
MKIALKIMGPVKKKTEKNPVEVEIPENSTILDVMKKIGYTETEANYLVYVKDGETLKPRARLNDGDYIQTVLQVGGG